MTVHSVPVWISPDKSVPGMNTALSNFWRFNRLAVALGFSTRTLDLEAGVFWNCDTIHHRSSPLG
jgi:hypothetical protein